VTEHRSGVPRLTERGGAGAIFDSAGLVRYVSGMIGLDIGRLENRVVHG
jgi:hypothetical protein